MSTKAEAPRPEPRFDWFIPIDGDGGHIDLNVVPGGIQGDFERLGEQIDHDRRYDRADEFIAALRALWAKPEPVVFEGSTIRLRGAIVSPGPVGEGPRFYVGGASPRALEFAAREADVYLAWIQPVRETEELLARVRTEFDSAGRPAVFGLRTHLIVRQSEREAWDAAEDLVSRADERVIAQRRAAFEGTPMVGQQAQLRQQLSDRAPRLWNGISKVRVNLGTAIVGDPEQVANELLAYWHLGIDEFILSGFPHEEECRRVAAEVLPRLRAAIDRERRA